MSLILSRLARSAAPILVLLAGLAAPAGSLPGPSVICIEVDRGLVLHEEHARVKRPPASMIKLMMMLMVVEGYERGDWVPETEIAVSEHAQRMGGTQVYLEAGETWPLAHLMRALAVASANDAAMAVAEGLWGSEEAYLEAANERAKALGMKDTVIAGVHGLPPGPGGDFDMTTAYDIALLAMACIEKPLIMTLVREKELQFRPKDATKYNTNKLLWRMADSDGLKTGYIRAAGFCIAATVERHGRRLVCVVMGHPSKYGRFQLAEDTFERFLDHYEEIRLLEKGVPLGVDVPVANAAIDTAPVFAGEDVSVLLPRPLAARVEVSAFHPETLKAPLQRLDVVGKLAVMLGETPLASVPLVVGAAVEPEGWYLTVRDGVARWNRLDPLTGSSEREGEPE